MSNRDHYILENSASGAPAFGSEAWYAARWRSHWEALQEEIRRLEQVSIDAAEANARALAPEAPSEGATPHSPPTYATLAFDGNDDYVELSKPINIDYTTGFTVEAWVCFQAIKKWSRIIDFGNGPTGGNIIFANKERSNTLVFMISGGEGGPLSAPNALEFGVWHHVAATVEENGAAQLYRDGQSIATGTIKWSSTTERKQNYIGRSHWTPPDEYFQGEMREVRIWQVARTQQQLADTMHKTLTGQEEQLVGYWRFNEGQGDSVKDLSRSGNDGRLGGGQEAQKPAWNVRTIDLQQYQLRKQMELIELTQSLRTFAQATFAFFHSGFFALAQKSAISSQPQADSTAHEPPQAPTLSWSDRMQALKKSADSSTTDSLTTQLAALEQPLFYTSKKYSPNFVLRSLIGQASYDLNRLQQIYYQRTSRERQAATTFLIAEELGKMALQPATSSGLLATRYRSMLCALGNRTEVRLLPYHNTVLLSVPHFANITSKQGENLVKVTMAYPMSFTAIPHEIGHILYRFGEFPLTKGQLHIYRLLRNRLLARPYKLAPDDWRFHWLEELFADAYGCLVAGPISVLGFQIMLADGPPQDGQEHLGDYPIPVLRPFIQSQILRKLRTQYGNPLFAEAPALLDARWQNWVIAHWPHWVAEKWLGDTEQIDVVRGAFFTIAGQRLTGQEIIDALQPLIDVILQTLASVRPTDNNATWTPHWNPTADTEKLTGLYQEFVRFGDELINKTLSTAAAAPTAISLPAGAGEDQQTLTNLLKQFDDIGSAGWRARSSGIDGLIELILFEGWSTEGPQAVGQH